MTRTGLARVGIALVLGSVGCSAHSDYGASDPLDASPEPPARSNDDDAAPGGGHTGLPSPDASPPLQPVDAGTPAPDASGDGSVPGGFDDVPSSSPHAGDIEWVSSHGIASACAPNKFCPDASIPRRTAVAWAVRAQYGEAFAYDPSPRFPDVAASDPDFRYVQKAAETGIVSGYPDGTFKPDGLIPRPTMAVIVVRASEGNLFPYTQDAFFTDIPAGHYAFTYVQRARDRELTYGCDEVGPPSTLFCATEQSTRAQFATFIRRAFDNGGGK